MSCLVLRSVWSVLAFLLVAPAQERSGDPRDIDRILERSVRFSHHVVRADLDSIASFYSVRGRLLAPGTRILEGRAAARQVWTRTDGSAITTHRSESVSLRVEGASAVDIGYYEGTTRTGDGRGSSFKGKYVILWTKIDGEWFMEVDIWNPVRDP